MASTSLILPGQPQTALGYNYGPDTPFPWFYITGAQITSAASAFVSLSNLPAYNSLLIVLSIPAVGGSDKPLLRFNGDTGTNYVSRTITAAAGGVTLTDAPVASATSISVGIASAFGRVAMIHVSNIASRQKVANITIQQGITDATAPPPLHIGAMGMWNNTSAQISQVDCLTGGQTMAAGSSIMIYGGL